jgi:hypothetical protein
MNHDLVNVSLLGSFTHGKAGKLFSVVLKFPLLANILIAVEARSWLGLAPKIKNLSFPIIAACFRLGQLSPGQVRPRRVLD